MWYTSRHTPNTEAFHSKSTTRNWCARLLGRLRGRMNTGGALLVEVSLPKMKKTITVLAASLFLFPTLSMASGLNYQQASSIIVLLQAFNVNQALINTIWEEIQPEDTPLSPPTVATTQTTSPAFGGTTVVSPQTNSETSMNENEPIANTVVQNDVASIPISNPTLENYISSVTERINYLQNLMVNSGCISGVELPPSVAGICIYAANEIMNLRSDLVLANTLTTIQLSDTCDAGIGGHFQDLMNARDDYYSIMASKNGSRVLNPAQVNAIAAPAVTKIGSIQSEIQSNISTCVTG